MDRQSTLGFNRENYDDEFRDSQFYSNLASADEQQHNGKYQKPEITGTKIAYKHLADFQRDYSKNVPFERGQFNQSIPNPSKEGEYITVQFVKRSLLKAYNVPGARQRNATFDTYSLEVPQVESDGESSSSSSDEEGQEEIKEEKSSSHVSGLSLIDNSLPLFDERRMLEQIDETQGIKSYEFAKVVQND